MPDDLARIRLVAQRELETITAYEELARAAASPDIRAFLLHLAREEKEHVAEALHLIRSLDPDQAGELAKDFGTHLASAASPELAGERPFTPPGSTAGRLTVGSLRRRRDGETP